MMRLNRRTRLAGSTRPSARPQLEGLELRYLPSTIPLPSSQGPLPPPPPSPSTLLQPSYFLGFGIGTPASAQGTITSDNVDWYTFTLSTPTAVTIQTTATTSNHPLTALLS